MDYDDYITNFKELYHFGIKGMRLGVRRFQNKDGSLTKAGEKRYSNRSNITETRNNPNINRFSWRHIGETGGIVQRKETPKKRRRSWAY